MIWKRKSTTKSLNRTHIKFLKSFPKTRILPIGAPCKKALIWSGFQKSGVWWKSHPCKTQRLFSGRLLWTNDEVSARNFGSLLRLSWLKNLIFIKNRSYFIFQKNWFIEIYFIVFLNPIRNNFVKHIEGKSFRRKIKVFLLSSDIGILKLVKHFI